MSGTSMSAEDGPRLIRHLPIYMEEIAPQSAWWNILMVKTAELKRSNKVYGIENIPTYNTYLDRVKELLFSVAPT